MLVCFVSDGVFFCKQKTAYEMRISDWSSDVCSSDLADPRPDSWRFPSSRRTWRSHASSPERSPHQRHAACCGQRPSRDRKSVVSGRSGSVRVVLGGRRMIKKKIDDDTDTKKH